MSTSWETVRRMQVQVIISASHNVDKAQQKCGETHREVDRLTRELKKAQAAYDAAVIVRDTETAKVEEFVREYQHIGEDEDQP